MKKPVRNFLIKENISVRKAMHQMGKAGERILFVVNGKNQLLGSLTDGDIRRWVLSGGDISSDIRKVYHTSAVSIKKKLRNEELKKLMIDKKIPGLPLVDETNEVKDIFVWNSVFGKNGEIKKGKINIPIVIMAGGFGTRLDPFTKILPKPLIPIGEKSILELIMDKFKQYGVKEFYLTISHKSRMIKAYIEESDLPYKIHYLEEKTPLGTAGSLRMLSRKIKGSFFVSNCDIIIETNYHDIMQFHQKGDYDVTIVGSFRHFTIPYGICHLESGGTLSSIQEKPEYDYLVNTGMYVAKKEILKFIPRGKHYDFTELINDVKKKGGNIGVFPIDANSWIDVGQWEEYHKSIKQLELQV